MFENAQHGRRWTAQSLDLPSVIIKDRNDAARSRCGLLSSVPDAGKEEVEPRLPVAVAPDSIQQLVVGRCGAA